MDLTSYVNNLGREFATLAEAGGPEARALVERLTGSLESAIRMTLLDALSAAADEITQDLAPGSVEVRLRGIEPGFVVTPPLGEPPEPETAAPSVPLDTDDGTTSRINLRLPAQLKSRVEEAAGREGLSVNAWLVRALASAVESDAGGRPSARSAGQRYTGWVR
jgi:HicB-like protein involved in pilus formation